MYTHQVTRAHLEASPLVYPYRVKLVYRNTSMCKVTATYIYIYEYVNKYLYTCIHTWYPLTCTYIFTYIHIHAHMHIYIYIYIYIYVYVYKHMHICLYMYSCVCIYTYIYTYTYMYMYECVHTYILYVVM